MMAVSIPRTKGFIFLLILLQGVAIHADDEHLPKDCAELCNKDYLMAGKTDGIVDCNKFKDEIRKECVALCRKCEGCEYLTNPKYECNKKREEYRKACDAMCQKYPSDKADKTYKLNCNRFTWEDKRAKACQDACRDECPQCINSKIPADYMCTTAPKTTEKPNVTTKPLDNSNQNLIIIIVASVCGLILFICCCLGIAAVVIYFKRKKAREQQAPQQGGAGGATTQQHSTAISIPGGRSKSYMISPNII